MLSCLGDCPLSQLLVAGTFVLTAPTRVRSLVEQLAPLTNTPGAGVEEWLQTIEVGRPQAGTTTVNESVGITRTPIPLIGLRSWCRARLHSTRNLVSQTALLEAAIPQGSETCRRTFSSSSLLFVVCSCSYNTFGCCRCA